MEYEICSVTRYRYESIDIKFRRAVRMMELSMSLKRPVDEIYRRVCEVARYGIDFLDMRDYLESR